MHGVDDCRLNGNTSIADLNPTLAVGLPQGAGDGVPYLEQETDFYSLRLDWDISENISTNSVSGYAELNHWKLDVYDYNAGVFGGQHRNVYEAFSQEIRIASSFDSPFNFMIGALELTAGVRYTDEEKDGRIVNLSGLVGDSLVPITPL